MQIHLLRLSRESETMRKFVMCITSPLKSNRTKWHPHNLKFCKILKLYCCIPQVLIILIIFVIL